MNHTIMVTLVGQEILLGKHTSEGGVTPVCTENLSSGVVVMKSAKDGK